MGLLLLKKKPPRKGIRQNKNITTARISEAIQQPDRNSDWCRLSLEAFRHVGTAITHLHSRAIIQSNRIACMYANKTSLTDMILYLFYWHCLFLFFFK